MVSLVAGLTLLPLGSLVSFLSGRAGVALEALGAGRAFVALETDRAHLASRPLEALPEEARGRVSGSQRVQCFDT